MSQDIEVVVIDEAHNLEDKVRSATTEKYSQRGIEMIRELSRLSIRDYAMCLQNFIMILPGHRYRFITVLVA